jgi:hypothetical protein
MFPDDETFCWLCKKLHNLKLIQPTKLCDGCLNKRPASAYKSVMVEYFGGKCQVCGYSKCNRSLEFHHVNPGDKEFSICQQILKKGTTSEMIYRELLKCVMLCTNCHSEYHQAVDDIKWTGQISPLIQRVKDIHYDWLRQSKKPFTFV